MAYYPRVFYENGDDSGGSGASQAAAEIAASVKQQKNLTEAFEATKKAEAEAQAARDVGNEQLARDIEEQNRLKRVQLGITQEQLALMDERVGAQERLTEAERLAAEDVERESLRQLELLQQREEAQEGLLGIASKVIAAAKEQTKELDKQRVALGKNSGLFGQFNQQLTNSVAAAARFGKGTAEVGATIGSLANGMMNFTQMSQANQKTLIDGSLALQQFGVNAEQSAAANDFLMNSLGKSAEEAVGYQKGLIELGAEIGMSGAMLVEKFGSMSGDLAKFGDNAEEVFENLAKTAKATGVEMSELLSVASQFDTFEGAASAVGKLNAQMGTNIDAMALMQEEDPTKQIDMLRDAFLATGKDLSSMSKFEKMAAAEAMGMKLPELQKLLAPKKEATETDKNFDKLIEMTTTFGQKLSAVGKQFAVFFTPVISIFVDVLEFVGEGISMFSEFTKKIAENKAVVYTLATVMGALLLPILAAMAVKTTAATLAMVAGIPAKVKRLALGYKQLVLGIKTNAILIKTNAILIKTNAIQIKNNIADAARVVWTKLKTAATWLYSAAMNSNLGALIRTTAATIASGVATAGRTVATGLATAATSLYSAAMNFSLGALITTTAATIASGVATAGLQIATGLATGATWLFNAALAANPIGLIIIGVLALVAGFYMLSDSLGGLGGLWDTVVSGMAFAWENLADIVFFLPLTLYKAFKFAFNGIVKLFNSTLGQLSFTIPDWVPLVGGQKWGIPKIPLLAEGTANFEGGQAIVGEEGPEMVNLPRGAEVIPNDKLQQAQGATTAANKAADSKPPIIKLILNERELGQAVMDIIDKKLSVTTGIN